MRGTKGKEVDEQNNHSQVIIKINFYLYYLVKWVRIGSRVK